MIARYSRPEMAALWTAETRLWAWRDVELYALEELVALGEAPASALEECRGAPGPSGRRMSLR